MSQIDRTLIIDMSEEVLDEFVCGICHEIFVDPMVTQCCRQTYCNECISQWLRSHPTCPNDRRVLSRSQLTPPARAMINLFNNMKMKCKYHTNGCQTVLKVSEMSSHLNTCAHNVCEECGIGRPSDEKHNCIQNLKIKIESINSENKRLSNENKTLSDRIKRIGDENTELKKYKLNPISNNHLFSRNSMASREPHASTHTPPHQPPHQPRSIENRTLKDFMNGTFVLESKYKIIDCGQRIYSRTVDMTLEMIANGTNFVLIQSQSEGTETLKRFTLGQPFQWTRADGKHMISVFTELKRRSNPNESRLIETINDINKSTLYRHLDHKVYYDFDMANNHLTIEWTIGSIKKVEIYSRKLQEY